MGIDIHANGFVGLAFEVTYGTPVAPTRFFPIKSESMAEQYENQKRRVIRQVADDLGIIKGFSHVEGDIVMELIPDVLIYFLYASRNSIVKAGTTPNFTYTTTPLHLGTTSGTPKPGLTITIVKNGERFQYAGCVVSQLEISQDNGIPQLKVSLVGTGEAVTTLPTATWVATDTPMSTDMTTVEVPTAAQVFDVSEYTFTVNDNAAAQQRFNGATKAQFVAFGMREVSLSMTRDFATRTDWDAFKALTSQSVTMKFTKNANTSVTIKVPNGVPDTYEIDGLSDQGQVTSAKITWDGSYDTATSKSYEIVVKSQSDIT